MMWTLSFRRDSFVAYLGIAVLMSFELTHATCPGKNVPLEDMSGTITMTNDNPSRTICSWKIIQDYNRFFVLTLNITRLQCASGFKIAGVDYCGKTAPFTLVFHEKCWQPCNESNNCQNITYPVQVKYRDVKASKGFELTYSFDRCNKTANCEMGIKSKQIPDSAMTASSELDAKSKAYMARLDNLPSSTTIGCWSPKQSNRGEWIQVDFGSMVDVAGVITQGRPRKKDQWVTSFTVCYGSAKDNLSYVTVNGVKKVFLANTDWNTKVHNYFPKVLKCRYIRIYPNTYNNYMSMRIEFVNGSCHAIDATAVPPDTPFMRTGIPGNAFSMPAHINPTGSTTAPTMTKHSVAVATYSLSSPHTVYEKPTVSTVKAHGQGGAAVTSSKTCSSVRGSTRGATTSGKKVSAAANSNSGNADGGATSGATNSGKHGANASYSTTGNTNSTRSTTTVLVFAPSAVSATPILLGVLIPLTIILIIFLIVMVVLIRKKNPPATAE